MADGGSDTTAVCLAAALQADRCEIYKDTKCICTADPKLIPQAKKLPQLDYKQMMKLAKMGAKVMAAKAMQEAEKAQLTVWVKAMDSEKEATQISQVSYQGEQIMVSCTKKMFSPTKEILTILKNTHHKSTENIEQYMKLILKKNNVKEYQWNQDEMTISLIVDKDISMDIFQQVHEQVIEKKGRE